MITANWSERKFRMKINSVYRPPPGLNRELKSPWRNRNASMKYTECKQMNRKLKWNSKENSKDRMKSLLLLFFCILNFKYEIENGFCLQEMNGLNAFIWYFRNFSPFTEYWILTEWCVDTCNIVYVNAFTWHMCTLCVCVCVQCAVCKVWSVDKTFYELHQLTKPRTYRTLIVVFYDNLHFTNILWYNMYSKLASSQRESKECSRQ